MKISDYIDKYSTLRNIKRFNMECTIRPQDLMGHGYSVANLFYLLCECFQVKHIARADFYVLNHDFAEAFTGDLNRRVKDKNIVTADAWSTLEREVLPSHLRNYSDGFVEKELKSFGEIYWELFRLADDLDALLYCKEEVGLGNSHLERPFSIYQCKVSERYSELMKREDAPSNGISKVEGLL